MHRLSGPGRLGPRLRLVVTDVDGNVFLDWTSGVLVTNVGHCHPDLVKAVQDAAAKLLNNYECLQRGARGGGGEAGIRAAAAPRQVLLPEHRQRGHRSAPSAS